MSHGYAIEVYTDFWARQRGVCLRGWIRVLSAIALYSAIGIGVLLTG